MLFISTGLKNREGNPNPEKNPQSAIQSKFVNKSKNNYLSKLGILNCFTKLEDLFSFMIYFT